MEWATASSDIRRPDSPHPPVAAIDLGTNTILMVVGESGADGTISILDDVHAIARMGRGVDEHRRIPPETIDRVCRMLREYRDHANSLGVERVCAFGTSALRDAANKTQIINAVRERVDIDLIELSGLQEARFTFQGAAFGLPVPRHYAVIDIGGGSTELAIGLDARVETSASVDIGAVRVTERFFSNLPPSHDERQQAIEMITEAISRLPQVPDSVTILGVAGTVTTLGAIDMDVPSFDAAQINGHRLDVQTISRLSDQLLELSYDEICRMPQINEQRADIISAGALILKLFLIHGSHSQITVSTRGIRYGLLQHMLQHLEPSR